MDCIRLRRDNIALATLSELRGFCQSVYSCHDKLSRADICQKESHAKESMIAAPTNEPNRSMVGNELILLEAAQKILLAMEVGTMPTMS